MASSTLLLKCAGAAVLLGGMTLPAPAGSIVLAPHRATYALTLDGSKPSKQVESARGEIEYEIRGSACSGYSVKWRQETDLDTDGGESTSSANDSASWEDGEAKSYRFHVTSTMSEQAPEQTDGIVERQDGKLVVKTTQPEVETFELKGAVALPTQHVVKILTAAQAGEAVLEVPVYDGSPDGRTVYDTLTVIGKATTKSEGLEKAASSGPLAGLTRYPVTISYYEQGSGGQTPDYIISADLYDNGVTRALKLDYGDFVLRGTLSSYEALPAEACAK